MDRSSCGEPSGLVPYENNLNVNLRRWALGYRGSALHFIDNETFVYSCANVLNFVNKKGQHVRSITSAGKGIGSVAVSQTASLLAYAEASLEPLIHVLSYPQCSVTLSLKGYI